MRSAYITRDTVPPISTLKELKDLVGVAQGGDLAGPLVFSEKAIEDKVQKMLQLSREDFMKYAGIQ
eukprot:6791543-Lingulodinium_polyedra.AAC.1